MDGNTSKVMPIKRIDDFTRLLGNPNRMNYKLFVLPLFSFLSVCVQCQEPCIKKAERELYERLNSERKAIGLDTIELSAKLSEVAAQHVHDLMVNKPYNDKCNPHSWSDEGDWDQCCYTSDHANPECMWEKPSELTDYPGKGYEIVALQESGSDPSAEISPAKAVELWMESKGHSSVILNQNSFSSIEWKAIGVAIEGNWASVWFGRRADESKAPRACP